MRLDKWLNEIKEDFTQDYIYSHLNNNELRKKYKLSHGEFKQLSKLIKTEYSMKRRPVNRDKPSKYYYKHKYGFIISKRINGENIYLGFVQTEAIAKKIIEVCKNVEWDITSCKKIISKNEHRRLRGK